MNINKLLKFANTHYPYYDWKMEIKPDGPNRHTLRIDAWHGSYYRYTLMSIDFFYWEFQQPQIKQRIREIAKMMKKHLREEKKNASA